MNTISWDPFNEFNQLFQRPLHFANANHETAKSSHWSPLVDIFENEKAFLLHAELPGIDKKAFNVSVDNNVLTITGEKQLTEVKQGENHHRIETQHGEFTRRFNLPDDVDVDAIAADYSDGVLKLSIPKVKPAKPKMIDVKIN